MSFISKFCYTSFKGYTYDILFLKQQYDHIVIVMAFMRKKYIYTKINLKTDLMRLNLIKINNWNIKFVLCKSHKIF